MTKEEINELTLEETFSMVDGILDRLADDDLKLEESFDTYKEGMEMLSHCRDIIETVEKKVYELSKETEETEELE